MERVGTIRALWRYPVKSMAGERQERLVVTERGVLGDRAYALVDRATGNLVSAKNPRKWQAVLACRARLERTPTLEEPLPPALITLGDGTIVRTDAADAERRLSAALQREVTIACGGMARPRLEKYWPDLDKLARRNEVSNEEIMADSFFDGAPIHLLTTASLATLTRLYPTGYFDARRFRPNIVVEPEAAQGFIENDWVGRTLALGPEVVLSIWRPTPRCVIVTLEQGELPRDLGILRTAAQENKANVGVYATVLRGGTMREDDAVMLQ
ncbi:MAG TPA: MOSC N-terminal beta barrel domain-containing protein [Candidatus Binataceae bacterium]|jgi:uncharacterized protein YcbX|nr:MOSC N-terminal beta barrel domain-containing protein [Candidatus Binataceae bacterium]